MPSDKQGNSSDINGMSPSGLPTKTGHVSSDSPNLDLANFSLPKLTSLGTKYVKEEVSRGGSSVHLQVKLHGKDVGQTMELRHGPEVKKDNQETNLEEKSKEVVGIGKTVEQGANHPEQRAMSFFQEQYLQSIKVRQITSKILGYPPQAPRLIAWEGNT